jgi:hypothetical protein
MWFGFFLYKSEASFRPPIVSSFSLFGVLSSTPFGLLASACSLGNKKSKQKQKQQWHALKSEGCEISRAKMQENDKHV